MYTHVGKSRNLESRNLPQIDHKEALPCEHFALKVWTALYYL